MIQYPYQGRNLFSQPVNYSYADCSQQDFLSSWLRYREEIIEQLESISHPSPEDYPSWAIARHLSETGKLFMKAKKLSSGKSLANRIEPFVVKYEVNKRLYSQYDSSFKKAENSGLANTHDYLVFGECLARIASEIGSLKHLSTLIKLCDALCSTPTPYPLSLRVIALLKSEIQLVANVNR